MRGLKSALGAGAVPLAAAGPAAAQRYEYGPHMMWDGGWFMMLGPIMMLLFIAVLVVLVVAAIRWLQHGSAGFGPGRGSSRAALDVLKERLARGEIGIEEYEARKRALGDD